MIRETKDQDSKHKFNNSINIDVYYKYCNNKLYVEKH